MKENQDADLSPLDLARDPARFEALVERIARAAAPELARRSRQAPAGPAWPIGIAGLLAGWLRPALAAAALLAVTAGLLLAVAGGDREPAPGIAEALGYPAPVTAWVEAGESPPVEELLAALEGSGDGR